MSIGGRLVTGFGSDIGIFQSSVSRAAEILVPFFGESFFDVSPSGKLAE